MSEGNFCGKTSTGITSGSSENDRKTFKEINFRKPVGVAAIEITDLFTFKQGKTTQVKFTILFQREGCIIFYCEIIRLVFHSQISHLLLTQHFTMYTGVSLYGLRITRSTSLYGLVLVRITRPLLTCLYGLLKNSCP